MGIRGARRPGSAGVMPGLSDIRTISDEECCGGGRLVQNHQRRVPEEGARQREPLPLPGRQVGAVDERRPEQRLYPSGKLAQHRPGQAQRRRDDAKERGARPDASQAGARVLGDQERLEHAPAHYYLGRHADSGE